MRTNDFCPLCSGHKTEGITTFAVDLGSGVIVIRHVPALMCDQCGMEWIDDATAEILEKIVEDLRQKGSIVEVREFSRIAS
jgi:YgiT-type zinc finger domain-containing protein